MYETQVSESFFQIAKKRRITSLPGRLSIIPQLYKSELEDNLELDVCNLNIPHAFKVYISNMRPELQDI